MIRNPIDTSVRVSPLLSEFIERRVNDPDTEQPISLGQVRHFMADMLSDAFKEAESMHHFDASESLLDELDALIYEYGEDALAVEFAQTSASEPLSRVIEAVVDDENRENPPTLAEVQDAMANGLVTHLVGDGVLEDDEDDALQAELEALIGRYGPDALVEAFLRYE